MKTILCIDKEGIIAPFLYKALPEYAWVLIAGKKPARFDEKSENLFIPYRKDRKKLPVLPSLSYAEVLVIYNGEKELSSAISGIGKEARLMGASLSVVVRKKEYPDSFVKSVLEVFRNPKIFIVGDLFGQETLFDRADSINRLLYEAKSKRKLKISMQADNLYPVSVSDLSRILAESFLAHYSNEKAFYLFPRHPYTEFSFSRLLTKLDPLLAIDFSTELPKKIPEHELMAGVFIGDYQLKESLRDILVSPFENRKDVKKGGKGKRFAWSYLVLAFGIMLFPIVSTLILSQAGMLLLNTAKANSRTLSNAELLFSLAEKTVTPFIYQSRLVGREDVSHKLVKTIENGKEEVQAIRLFQESIHLLFQVISGKSSAPAQDIERVQNSLRQFFIKNSSANGFEFLGMTVETIPQILAVNTKKTYLVLFENNTKLRPTGGKIDAYGIVTFENGAYKGIEVKDLAEVDKKLTGHIEPPLALRRYLKEEHTYLKDSNFNTDFAKSATVASQILSVATGQNAEAVFSLDRSFFARLLKVMGPLSVSSEIVTESTFSERLDKGGVVFLAQFVKAFEQRLLNTKENSSELILDTFSAVFAEKHALLFFLSPAVQKPFELIGVSSALPKEDVLGITETHVSGAASNHIQRKTRYEVAIDKAGSVSSKLTLQFVNPQSLFNTDVYKTYIELLLPKGTALSFFSIDSESLEIVPAVTDPKVYTRKNFKAPAGIEIEKREEEKSVYGFYLEIPDGEKTVKVGFEQPAKINTNTSVFPYTLNLYKQPGRESDPIEVLLKFPESYTVLKTHQFRKNNGTLLYTGSLLTDTTLSADFQLEK